MSDNAQLTRDGTVLNLQGRVNYRTVTSLFRVFSHELVKEITTLDCSQVEQCDSSAISLLLSSLRLAQNQGINLQIYGMNQQMLSLARLYDVEDLLHTRISW